MSSRDTARAVIDYVFEHLDEDKVVATAAARAAFDRHGGYISDETLAWSITEQEPPADATSIEVTLDGHDVTLGVQRAGD